MLNFLFVSKAEEKPPLHFLNLFYGKAKQMCYIRTALSLREGPPLSQSVLLGVCPTTLFGTEQER